MKAKRLFNEDVIHDVRVEYKKLRAFLRMISSKSNNGKSLKVSHYLKNCYVIAGSIRDLQLQQKFILNASKDEVKKPWDYIHLLQKHIDKSKAELRKTHLQKKTKNGIQHLNISIPASFDLPDFKCYRIQMTASFNSIIQQEKRSDDDIHQVRKLLKDFFYNLKGFKKAHGDIPELDGISGVTEERSKDLLEEFGKYQDSATSIEFLRPDWLQKLKPSTRKLLTQINSSLIKDHANTRLSLEDKLAQFSTALQ